MILNPTEEQTAILTAAKETETSLFIQAGAGCGKTTTLEMLSKVLPRKPSICLAFNVKIKEELQKRFPAHFEVMTFNALGQKAIARFLNKQQLMVDKTKLNSLLKVILQNENLVLMGDKFSQVVRLCTYAMQEGLVPNDPEWSNAHSHSFLPDNFSTWEQLALDAELTITGEEIYLARDLLILSIKESLKGRITFDDQIYISVFFAWNNFPRFSQCMVDEAQDLSPLNREMIKYTCPTGRLFVVGDPFQSIYSFRGADSNSLQNLRELRKEWITLPLQTTFRCPQEVVKKAARYATGYKAAPNNPQGEILNFLSAPSWCINDYIETSPTIAILCRNNAPLLTFAFSLLSNDIPCEYLGRDIGKSLERLVKSIAGSNLSQDRETFLTRLQQWEIKECGKYLNSSDSIMDRCDSVRALFGTRHKTVYDCLAQIEVLSKMEKGKVTLATGHKAKGLEWHTVVHLDPWRVPSKYAKSVGGAALTQEQNVEHVITTRTQSRLILANLENHYHSEELKELQNETSN